MIKEQRVNQPGAECPILVIRDWSDGVQGTTYTKPVLRIKNALL
jgi:hypothetical protein